MRLLSELLADAELMRMTLTGLIAVIAFLSIFGVLFMMSGWFDPVRRRLYNVVDDPMRSSKTLNAKMLKALDAAEPYITPQSIKERWTAQGRLLRAGYRNPNALKIYYGIKTLLIVALPLLTLALLPLLDTSATLIHPKIAALSTAAMKHLGLVASGAAAFGMILPSYVLDKKIANRQTQILNGFPDALDLLVVCSEAGLGLGSAFIRVANELEASHPILAEELAIVNAEALAGVERTQALQGLARRTGLDDIRGLVALLSQSINLGSSIADALRIYSEDFRDKRMQRAEEQAAKLGTKMIFPMVFCFFPGFFIVALGPAFLKLAEVFSKH
jgi:tight adherence protein C